MVVIFIVSLTCSTFNEQNTFLNDKHEQYPNVNCYITLDIETHITDLTVDCYTTFYCLFSIYHAPAH